ncbi:MAG: nuclear transport factor 2 family protein [Rhodopseudomonas palustris]|uniref:Nuclear transport factor 2 family protein n=1 Tax=Rhodopseudomonas palustris TaxID=1076 RepID=A0A933RZV9_RHOPL|nr:nuclear transport factor 2 family protein [Rhodopseudomonas palustris]
MTLDDFRRLLTELTRAAEAADGERFARCFTEDGVYYDYIYGVHRGRKDIAHMLVDLFRRDAGDDYRWEMFDPVFDGTMGYAWSLSSFTSLVPQFKGRFVVIDGMSRFVVRDGLFSEYRESVNGGVAMQQLGVEPERMAKVFNRWSGWLKERPETQDYLARPRAHTSESPSEG